jgi:lipoprotein-releasing system ATP-binding protein
MSDLVSCRGLVKTYESAARRVEVLKGLDLAVRRGEMVAIVGESGVGKSTLLHLLGALDRWDAGTYIFAGTDVGGISLSERAAFRNLHVGFVFQFHHLLPELTALENVMLPGLIAGGSRRECELRARSLLSELGIEPVAGQYPSEMSGGEQQRTAVARSLMRAPELILADEPTGNLDPATAERVFGAFRRVQRERGVAAVVATHNGKLAGRCDRVLRLRDGILLAEDPSVAALEAAAPG